jgi:predicted transcriptional regulator
MSVTVETRLTNHEKCLRAYELREEFGCTYAEIARRVDIDSDTVRRWITNPTKFDPYYDEVALMRALEGERKVYDRLTYWEEYEFYRRTAFMKQGMTHTQWSQQVGELSGKLGLTSDAICHRVAEAASELA